MSDYRHFIKSKRTVTEKSGFEVDDINPRLFDWQRDIVRWACRTGRADLFEECGLGKTIQQLEWSRQVWQRTGNGSILILTPVAVASQTVREAEKFSIACEVKNVASQAEVIRGINVTNYEKLHLFDCQSFDAVVLDEASILKSYTGATKRQLCEAFARTPYKLGATATPAPNDRKELGNQSEFLGIMPSAEMLSKWFINDTMKAGGYRLRKHGAKDFWRWVASWAVCISKPSDIGHSDAGYSLPSLNMHEHVVESKAPAGCLFHPGGKVSATEVHTEKRAALEEKADVVADLVNGDREFWAVWCDTDYEADALCKRIPDAVEVRGSMPDRVKEERLRAFSEGQARVIVTKPEIGGFGLNWQHCNKTTWFAGYSFERFYQSIRRLWRFGQKRPVDCHVVMSDTEQSIVQEVQRKQREHQEMHCEMAALMREGMMEELYESRRPVHYAGHKAAKLPKWLKSKGAC